MNITILNGSPRRNGNTATMIQEFCKGAQEAGHHTDMLNVANMKIGGCLACEYCQSHDNTCVQKDDMQKVYDSLEGADLVVFASPIYWFDMTSQLKASIDRMYAKAPYKFNFHKVAMFLDCAGNDVVFEAPLAFYKIMTTRMNWKNEGVIAVPFTGARTVSKNPDALTKLYEFGKNLTA